MTQPEIVLASNSPRRKQMLAWLGLPFTTAVADIDESPVAEEGPKEYVLRLAEEKARFCARYASFNGVILAADTTVEDRGMIIGKPNTESDAARILNQLRGRTHVVHTAIVLSIPSRGTSSLELCSTQVGMRDYSQEELDRYVSSGDAMDKAGAYAIQDENFHPVSKMTGCFASVMGLPLCHLERQLRKLGFGVRHGIPYRCQDELAYTCPIFKRILSGEDIG